MDIDKVMDVTFCFTSIFYEALPFIILGSVIAGILEHAIPQHWITRWVPKNRYAAIAASCFLGLIFPMCECGIVPIMRRLLRKGLPLSCCTAYMMAGPVINVVVIGSTVVAFYAYDGGVIWNGWRIGGLIVVALRVGLAFIVAFVTSCIIDRQYRQYGNNLLVPAARPDAADETDIIAAKRGRWTTVGLIAETALHDFVDITMFLTLGAMLSAISRLLFTPNDIAQLGDTRPALAVLAMMGLAILLCLCSEADAFVAASFSTLSIGPKIAFLVLGPMQDLKLYLLFTRVFSKRVIWTIIACVVIQSFVYSMVVHYTVPDWVGRSKPVAAGG